jgi:D-3-phosphoglycerate dehydrogenase
VIALFVDRGFPMEPFAEALAGEIDCRAEVGPDEAGDVVAIVTGTPPVGAAEVAPFPNLRLVLTCTIGTDHLDVAGLRDRGLVVANTPTYCTQEVAEHALACVLAGLRGLPRLDAAVRAGTWDHAAAGVPLRFADATLGIVGLGRIGRALATLAAAVGLTVVAHDPYAASDAIPLLALDDLLARSDVVSLHAPGGGGVLLGPAQLARLKPTATLLNLARPDLVDLDAMVAALRAGRLGGAFWDVWPQEPADPGDPRLQAPGLVVTPHAAWHSARADQAYRDEAVAVLRDVLVSGS